MVDDDFRVEVVGHATLRVQRRGFTLVTDPWLIDPIGCDSGFHFPPLVHDARKLAAETDAIYLSHIHPDHFHPPSLQLFAKSIPVFIGDYRRKDFRDEVRALGFPVIEVPFQTPMRVGDSDLEVTLIEHDYEESAAYDSSVVIRTPEFTVFENNDCFLRPAKYEWVRAHFAVDYAFLGYSPASFFPICFEMDEGEKDALLKQASERRYNDFLHSAKVLAPKLAVPFASDARFLLLSAVWKNRSFNSPAEALRRLEALGIAGAVLGPGDRIEADGRIRRVSTVYASGEELKAIEQYAARVQDWVVGLRREATAPGADLVERFRDYILGLREQTRHKLPGVEQYVIAYHLLGAVEEDFYFDFTQPPGAVFRRGKPPHYDMRYTYPAGGVQLVLDGQIDWDELHFTDEVSVHQVRYAREFYMMLRSAMLDLG